ncbi:MAG: outer membrane protein assembly factor BamA [Pseudomonadota bacterium]|nr:outer membrane protein assembly factor BamA [Pseudomonadota bacterium]
MRVLLKLLLCLLITVSLADNNKIQSIKYLGLHRLTKEALTPWVDLGVGDEASKQAVSQQIKKFYESQNFESITSNFENGDLTFTFVEEPIISAISFEGNTVLSDKELEKPAENAGLKPGRPFNPTKFKQFIYSISQEYQSKGYLDIDIKPDLEKRFGKVNIKITIEEHNQTRYGKITFDGNEQFSDGALRWATRLQTFNPISWLRGTYIYSEENFDMSIRTLYEYYYDRGYLEFEVLKKDVTFDDKNRFANVYINLFEGSQYKLKSITMNSSVQLPKSILIMQEAIEQQPYSRADLMKLIQMTQDYLKDMGYAYASIIPKQNINSDTHEVSIELEVKPEKIYHIRKINFHGNNLSNTTMLRRYMKQNEGQRFSQKELEASKNRLLGLDYFNDVNYKINPVPGFSDQVDIDYNLDEKDSVNSIMGEFGWGKSVGLTLGADLKFKNFFGSGNQVIMSLKSTKTQLSTSLTHIDPFYTEYGITRSTKLYYTSVDTDKVKASDFKSKNIGASIVYGIPVSRYSKMDMGINLEQSEFRDSDNYSQQINDFISQHGNSYTNFAIKLGLAQARYEENYKNQFNASLELGLPVFRHELTYYTLSIMDRFKYDLYRLNPKESFRLELNPKISYGQGYDEYAGQLPFFKRYHAGGFGSVRNYNGYSLGPKDSKGDALGGDLLTVIGTNLYFPMPFIKNNPFESALFLDVGNVYKNNFSADELRGSVGLMLLLKIGQMPIGFTFAKPINDKATDDFNTIDFALGVDF